MAQEYGASRPAAIVRPRHSRRCAAKDRLRHTHGLVGQWSEQMSTPPASRLEGPLHKLVTPQPDPSATLSTTLRDSYAIVSSPVTQGPEQRFSNRSAPWGIPKRGGVESFTSRGRRSIQSAAPVQPMARLPPLREPRARREQSRTGSGKTPMVRRPAFPEASA